MPTDEVERWRVFLAIEVPAAVREALGGPLSGLEPMRESIRINAADRIHLTLHFLGHRPRSEVEQLPSALGPSVARHQGFRLNAEGVGAFPDMRRPRVLWAGLTGADLSRLTALQAELGDALRKSGVALEDRFHPHLTLARVVRPPRAQERTVLRGWSTTWARASFGDIPVERVQLIRSQLGGGPARYTTLATFDLQ